MDIGLIVVRLLHVVLGAFWVGAIFFTALFLMPAIAAAGPDGAKVAQGLQDRGFMKVMPVVAILTMLSGIDLLRRASAGFEAAWFSSPKGITFTAGGAAAILAFLVGMFIMRPAMMKAQTLPPAEAAPLRARAMQMNRVVATLLLLAVIAMAVGRYV